MTRIFNQLDRIFHPRSIALVGITTSNPFHWTRTFWDSLREFKFEGPIYPVNPRGGELDGCKVYRSLDEVPGDIDYVIGTVSAKIAPEIVQKCAGKNVRAIHFCTAGFNETGEENVAGLQEELARLARESGVRIIGPNCMGIYCPESRLAFDVGFAKESGSVGFISQSGGNSVYVVREAGWRGVRFSKLISYGNACDLDESDFLEYMTGDPKTKIIAIYLEGVKDGKRFFRAMERAASKKPVVLLKAGYGEAGARATASHTASLAGNNATWDAFCRQFNVINVKNAESMVDILVTLTFFPHPSGSNVILMGPGGGASVLLTDEFERQGFRLPPVPDSVRKQLLQFSNLAGNMLRNPIDYSQNMTDADTMARAVKILTSWDGVDFFVGYFRTSQAPPKSWLGMKGWGEGFHNAYSTSQKPTVMVIEPALLPDWQKIIFPMMQRAVDAGIPIYYSFSGAPEALKTVIDYNKRRKARQQI